MDISKEKMWRSAERALKRTERYQEYRAFGQEENYALIYVLAKGKHPRGDDVVAVAGYENEAIQFYPFGNGKEIDLWGFNFERDLFECLQEGYELAGMSMKCHVNVWYAIEDWHECGIEHEKGLQKYLGYCKRNGITKERLEKEAEYEGMDVMAFYDPKADRAKNHEDRER